MVNEFSNAQLRQGHIHFKELFLILLVLFVLGSLVTVFVLQSQHPLRIAFMSDRDGNNEIYIMEKDGSGVENITNNDAEDGFPGWSAKNRSIAFLTTRESALASIYKMNALGNRLEALVTDQPIMATLPMWSPDGKWIAFENESNGQSDIYLIDIQTGESKNLTDNPSTDRFSDWSPDSEKILMVSNRGDLPDTNPGLYVIDVEDSSLLQLTEPDSINVLASWSPDGENIAFTSDRDGNAEIYLMDSKGENVTRLTNNQKFDGFPTWSPDGSTIAYITLDEANGEQNPEIYLMNKDGSNQRNISNHPAWDGYNWEFSWSPDGSQILFTTDRDGNLEIYIMDADGGNQIHLTNNPGNDLSPEWIQ
jgi:Tol biopolymer transport system component